MASVAGLNEPNLRLAVGAFHISHANRRAQWRRGSCQLESLVSSSMIDQGGQKELQGRESAGSSRCLSGLCQCPGAASSTVSYWLSARRRRLEASFPLRFELETLVDDRVRTGCPYGPPGQAARFCMYGHRIPR